MSTERKLFVAGLSYQMSDDDLYGAFASYGQIKSAKVITDRETGRSRGFGFVEFETAEAAEDAMRAMDGREVNGRKIAVRPAENRPRTGGR